ncbi:MAG: hypothetical protein H7X93_09125 [Sphingomonadaceae bacterium]|nr:hypothetical protein [Sphingomonadaceae bacterium]
MATTAQTRIRPRAVEAEVNYVIDTGKVETFFANDHSLDTVRLDPRTIEIADARLLAAQPRLDVEGFALFDMPSVVADWRDAEHVQAVHPGEIAAFIRALTGADETVVTGPPILRWGERSREAGTRDNSNAARLIHSDAAFSAGEEFTRQANPHPDRAIARSAHHNIWRAFSGPPIDVPLTVCDATSVRDEDIVEATAGFDQGGRLIWSFAAMNFRYNPAHRWMFWSDMTPDEVIVFKRYDTDRTKPRYVPHTAFTDPCVGAEATPRASVEMRTIIYWYQ